MDHERLRRMYFPYGSRTPSAYVFALWITNAFGICICPIDHERLRRMYFPYGSRTPSAFVCPTDHERLRRMYLPYGSRTPPAYVFALWLICERRSQDASIGIAAPGRRPWINIQIGGAALKGRNTAVNISALQVSRLTAFATRGDALRACPRLSYSALSVVGVHFFDQIFVYYQSALKRDRSQ
jgi:hypothetical protein